MIRTTIAIFFRKPFDKTKRKRRLDKTAKKLVRVPEKNRDTPKTITKAAFIMLWVLNFMINKIRAYAIFNAKAFGFNPKVNPRRLKTFSLGKDQA